MKSLGLREYARHRKSKRLPGGTLHAVQVAIDEGRLAKSVTRAKKIRTAAQADAEWAASTNADRVPLTGPTAPTPAAAPTPAPSRTDEHAPNPLAEARARREAANADRLEMDMARRRGELVPAKEVEAKFATMVTQCRQRLMSIPQRARQRDASLSAAHLVLIEAMIREALEELGEEAPCETPQASG